MTDTVRVGLIGAGYWGKNLLRNHATLGSLKAFCEIGDAARAAAAKAYPAATVYRSVDALLGASDIDAIVISTPAETHGDIARRALAAGKHVFVEKPLCLDLREAKALDEDATRRGLTLMVGHLLLFHPAFVALQDAVRAGKVGKLRYIYSNRLSLGKIRREENALWSFAPHDISMVLALAGALPTRVVVNGGAYLSPNIADTSLSHLTFADDMQAHIFVSWLHPYKDHRLVVVGSEGMIVFDDVVTGPDKLRLFPHAVRWDGEVPLVDRAAAETLPYEDAEPLARECRHFLDCVAARQRPRSDAAEGLRVLSVLDACQRALASGQAAIPETP